MVQDTLESALAAGTGTVALYWSGAEAGGPGFDLPAGVEVRIQRGEDLGARLVAAFDELLRVSDRAVVMGSDCPDLDPETIRMAFAALDDHALVLGPARDGGYYLIGLKAPAPALFEGIAWGTERVLAETLERARRLGLATRSLEVLADLDTPDDLVRLIARRSVEKARSGSRMEETLRTLGLLPPHS
jgi:rSAM/selenodomain-associated transferase 1